MPGHRVSREDRISEARRQYDMALDHLQDSRRTDLEVADALAALSLALTGLLRVVRQPGEPVEVEGLRSSSAETDKREDTLPA
jgi:hypothetical protein